jgi:hypothetical protein
MAKSYKDMNKDRRGTPRPTNNLKTQKAIQKDQRWERRDDEEDWNNYKWPFNRITKGIQAHAITQTILSNWHGKPLECF